MIYPYRTIPPWTFRRRRYVQSYTRIGVIHRRCSNNVICIFGEPHIDVGTGIQDPAIPVVPPLQHNDFARGRFFGVTQQLDGMECKECIFKDVVLEYSGGAYTLENCSFSGTIRVVLKGASANTVVILPLLEALGSGKPPVAPIPKRPVDRLTTAKNVMTISFSSPYSGE